MDYQTRKLEIIWEVVRKLTANSLYAYNEEQLMEVVERAKRMVHKMDAD